MANIFTLDNINDFSENLNIDDLYERKRQYDLNQLNLFNKILNRIHVRIKTTSRQKIDEQFCWFVVPEVMIGVPKFDQGSCIAYLIDKLKTNGFIVKYYHPNTLLILWNHWVPAYVRSEIKKKTGIQYDSFGKQLIQDAIDEQPLKLNNYETNNYNDKLVLNTVNLDPNDKPKKEYTPINQYKPDGKLIYNNLLLNKIEENFNN